MADQTLNLTNTPSKKTRELKTIGGYLITKRLGSGAMGDVYLAEHKETRQRVAIKVLLRPEDSESLDYFLREAYILKQLDHPNIIKLIATGNHSGKPYIVMEYVEGATLGNIIRCQSIESLEAAKIIYCILSALSHAAKYHVIHRDIKPDNIFIGNSGEVKLLDLGLAKIVNNAYITSLTRTGKMLGTPCFMPLEQIQNAKGADHRADIYAVGATLYNMLCGSPPFSECQNKLDHVFMAKIQNMYIRLKDRRKDIEPDLIAIVEKSMAHEPENRYTDFKEMQERIYAFITRAT